MQGAGAKKRRQAPLDHESRQCRASGRGGVYAFQKIGYGPTAGTSVQIYAFGKYQNMFEKFWRQMFAVGV